MSKEKKHGLYFEFDFNSYVWLIYKDGALIQNGAFYDTLEGAEQNLRSICQILYPHTIENLAVTEAIAAFKKKKL